MQICDSSPSRLVLWFRPRPRPWPTVSATRLAVGACGATLVIELATVAFGQVPATLDGPPVQVQPYVSEPGVPPITIPLGTPTPPPTSGSGSGLGSGSNLPGSSALNTMIGTTWGAQAIANAQAMGVNASALAATCVLESGCQNIGGSGTVAGAFQMTASTYTAMIDEALAANPSLAGQIVPGLAGQMDPATESIAASQYLVDGAQYLHNQGISNPTVLDVRGYYNFGPQGGAQIAGASPGQTMASVLTGYSSATLVRNGITPGETVGQWQAGVAAKIGNAASQSVLT